MTPTSIADFSLEAARRYLQSAVFIDDNIYDQVTANPESKLETEVRLPKPVLQEPASDTPERKSAAPDVVEAKPADVPFRTKDLVGSFARYGIVCALYEPEKNFPTDESSVVFRLCQTADLVILDWDFHEDGVRGTKPKALIQNLIRNGNRVAPHHVRLLAIYTNTPSLQSIANSIFQDFEKSECAAEPIQGCPLRLQIGSARIVVLGKAGGTERVAEEKAFTAAEKDLADRLLQEFASMNEGILPSCALLGMAAVRHNSRRVLDKFRSDFDGQFLLHRALIRSSEEAFDQLPELLADEFRAIVEDSVYRPADPVKFIAESSGPIPIAPAPSPWLIQGVKSDIVLREFWKQDNGLRTRLDGKDKAALKTDGPQPTKMVETLAMMCSGKDLSSRQRFAALLTARTQYQAERRILGFGTIVCQDIPDQNGKPQKHYSICIMPSCDSLRLKNETSFPFWRLFGFGKGNPVIVEAHDREPLTLVFETGKPSRYLWMASFAPEPVSGVIVSSKNDDGRHVFTTGASHLEWVSQLKPGHAQRIANAIGQQISRVGLTEAEWARITFADD